MKTNPSRATRPNPIEGREPFLHPRRFTADGVLIQRLVPKDGVWAINPEWENALYEEKIVFSPIIDFNPKKNRRKK
jgi:hypothetical protein